MKYTLGLLGVLLTCTSLWAAPEEMTMYTTLSAPIASFWKVSAYYPMQPVTMPVGSTLNLGAPCTNSDPNCTGTQSDAINLKDQATLYIETLAMADDTVLSIEGKDNKPATWLVQTLEIKADGEVLFGGQVLVDTLTLKPLDNNSTVTIKSKVMRLGSNVVLPSSSLSFDKIEVKDSTNHCLFCFSKEEGTITSGTVKTSDW